ncbi:MAG TPA: LysM peptidoglycan-binding domain-containing M23 family metallopeptidase [Stellaceae bacterium]|nr:LysM peptidoglycan-binding domain-containing M23 family metallopeptidase [Stellaceae bacterium]
MTRSGPLAAVIAVIVSAALAGCTRHGPPAPLSFPGAETKPQAAAPPPALVPQEHLPHPNQIAVAKGDTLYTIARRYDVPLRSIIDANHLDPPFRVAAGTTLDLPQERFHVVKQGDTLYGISRLYGVEVSTLASLNRLDPPYALRAGETLYLPASVEPPDKSTTAVAAAPDNAETPEAPGPKPDNGMAVVPGAPPEKPGQPSGQREASAAPPPEPTRLAPARTGKGFDWPVQGKIIERYGTGPNGAHNDGINIAARRGEPVRAADAGVVAYAGNELRGYGNLVLIKHPGGYMTAYAHNSQLLVKRGQVVKRGQEIAKAGSTGTVDSPQVHFEIRRGTRAIDPTSLLPSIQASAR